MDPYIVLRMKCAVCDFMGNSFDIRVHNLNNHLEAVENWFFRRGESFETEVYFCLICSRQLLTFEDVLNHTHE